MSDGDTSVLSGNEVASIRKEIKEIIRETIIEVFPAILRAELPRILIDVNEQTKLIEKAKLDAEEYMHKNPDKFNEVYKERIKLYEGYARCENLTKLYDECLQMDPVYIPRKYRDDRFFVRDEEELEIVNTRFMGKFQSEYSLLKKRQRDFVTAVNAQDDAIYELIEHCGVPDAVKTEIASVWERDVKFEEDKINKQWVKNIAGMKTAYEKDKQRLAVLNQHRLRKFEELRGSVQNTVGNTTSVTDLSRRVEVTDEENGLVISIGNNGSSDEQERSTNLGRATPVNGLATTTRSTTNTTASIGESGATTITTSNATTFTNVTTTAATIPSAPAALVVSTDSPPRPEIDVNDTAELEGTFDSSAPIFGSQSSSSDSANLAESDELTTQDEANIEALVNFTQTTTKPARVQSNYKFRKRPPLK